MGLMIAAVAQVEAKCTENPASPKYQGRVVQDPLWLLQLGRVPRPRLCAGTEGFVVTQLEWAASSCGVTAWQCIFLSFSRPLGVEERAAFVCFSSVLEAKAGYTTYPELQWSNEDEMFELHLK